MVSRKRRNSCIYSTASRGRLALLVLALASMFSAAAQAQVQTHNEQEVFPIPETTQFDDFENPPYDFDNVQGEVINIETQLIKPILVTSDEKHVVVANEPDNRLVVFDIELETLIAEIPLGQGIAAVVERPRDPDAADDPGEIWVSVRHQMYVAVIDMQTWTVSHLLRPPIPNQGVGGRRATMPGGIAFNADGSKAYVPSTYTDKVVIYDAVQKKWIKNLALRGNHNQQDSAQNDPMLVLHHDGHIYVASHLSGNQTIVDTLSRVGVIPSLSAFGPEGINPISVVDLDNDANRSLPDFDLMVIDTSNDLIVDQKTGIGTILFGMVYHPQSNRIVVSNFESRNGEFIGEGSWPNGRVVFNRITGLRTTDAPANYLHVVTEGLGPAGRANIVMPTDMAVDGEGRLYVAGYASSNIGVWASNGAFLGSMKAGAGPRGLAVANGRKRVYALNRADNSVSYYVVPAGSIPGSATITVDLPDPTYDHVKEGRRVFLDPSNSGAGTTGCFSCHHDARKDGLGWHLSAFFDVGDSFTNPDPVTGQGPPDNWKDLKGVMVTQDLRSLIGMAPYHWRGEQKDLEDFNGAFVGLLKARKELEADRFSLMKSYLLETHLPPNPFERMNRVFDDTALAGHTVYTTLTSDFAGPCVNCHKLPTGTDGGITEGLIGTPTTPVATDTAHLIGNWTKESSLVNIENNNPPTVNSQWPATGFGFFHEGSLDSIQEFNEFFFGFTQQQTDDLTEFNRQMDTGLAPCTSYSKRLAGDTTDNGKIGSYLIGQANDGNCDLVAKGRLFLNGAWQEVGLLWIANTHFVADQSSIGPFTWQDLTTLAGNDEADLLFLGVPVWSGERIGVDRDRDGVYDRDEPGLGLNPLDPDSDGDGMWDSYDPEPLNPNNTILPVGAPQVVPGSVRILFDTTNAVKIVYETDTFSPSRVEFGPTTAYGFFSGDPDQLPARSNRHKRRHAVFLRPQPDQGLMSLDDGTQYNFRILTRGQNGVAGQSANFTTNGAIETDVVNPNMRVESINLVASRNGSLVDYTATVKVVDNDGNALQGVQIRGRFAHYDSSGLIGTPLEIDNLVSDSQGIIVYTDQTSTQNPGDLTIFDIPMFDAFASPFFFHWPEGPHTEKLNAP